MYKNVMTLMTKNNNMEHLKETNFEELRRIIEEQINHKISYRGSIDLKFNSSYSELRDCEKCILSSKCSPVIRIEHKFECLTKKVENIEICSVYKHIPNRFAIDEFCDFLGSVIRKLNISGKVEVIDIGNVEEIFDKTVELQYNSIIERGNT